MTDKMFEISGTEYKALLDANSKLEVLRNAWNASLGNAYRGIGDEVLVAVFGLCKEEQNAE